MKHLDCKKTTVKKTAQRNVYFCNTDQLLGMCAYEDMTVRVKAVDIDKNN